MKKKTEAPKQSELTTPQLSVKELEGTFYGNSNDNNKELINSLRANPYAKALLQAYPHDDKGFIFDVVKAGRLAFLMQVSENKRDNGAVYEKLYNQKIAFFTVEQFNAATKKGTLGNVKVTVLHNPEKEFTTTDGEKYKVVNQNFIQKA